MKFRDSGFFKRRGVDQILVCRASRAPDVAPVGSPFPSLRVDVFEKIDRRELVKKRFVPLTIRSFVFLLTEPCFRHHDIRGEALDLGRLVVFVLRLVLTGFFLSLIPLFLCLPL